MATIREIREANFISRQNLARLAGVGLSTLERIEKGEHHVTPEVAEKVLQALGREIKQNLTVENVSGLNLYNAMRDRSRKEKAK